jgi:hypothetical protein
MVLPSSGPLTLANIQTEFGGSNPIGLSEYYAGGGLVAPGTSGTFGAVPSSGAIGIRNFYGTSGTPTFTAVFDNAQAIDLSDAAGGSGSFTYQATYTINTSGTCTKFGAVFGLDRDFGPNAWGTPTGGTPGNNFEARLNVTQFGNDGTASCYTRFAGVDVTANGFTPWYSLSSNRAIDVSSNQQVSFMEGTLYIRNTSTLVEISRAFAVYADPTN